MQTEKIKTPAKINLFLNITGLRADGFHLLESVFSPIDLFDTITVSASEVIECSVKNNLSHQSNFNLADNICVKAAQLLRQECRVKEGCNIEIEKNIPIGAGLGGGSSDAAATLKLLNKFWNLNLSLDSLRNLAIRIGADVPFFLEPRTSFVCGIGENIEPISFAKSFHLLLVNPNIHVSTAEVFRKGHFSYSKPLHKNDLFTQILSGNNALEYNAIKMHPEVQTCLDFLKNQQGCEVSRMSGTGATCFALFQNKEDLNIAVKNVPSNCWHYSQLLEL